MKTNCNGTCEICECDMKKAIKNLKKVGQDVKYVEMAIKAIKHCDYYVHFGTEAQRQTDLEVHADELRLKLTMQHTALEKIQSIAEKMKVAISQKQKELIAKVAVK